VVPEFWLATTQRLAPKGLCAMAIVSDSIAVRAAASGFRVMNALRGVPIEVKAFKPGEAGAAAVWVREVLGHSQAA
jgi:hypothetical protein